MGSECLLCEQRNCNPEFCPNYLIEKYGWDNMFYSDGTICYDCFKKQFKAYKK
jgi:hypothetical protein